jgi:hypothetical protein
MTQQPTNEHLGAEPTQPEIPVHTPSGPEKQPQPAKPEIPPVNLPGPEIPDPSRLPDTDLPGPEIPDPGPPPGPQPSTAWNGGLGTAAWRACAPR